MGIVKMDKRKQIINQRKVEQQRKEQEEKPSYKYMNRADLEFPQRLKDDVLADYGTVDDKLENIWLELSIIEEQRKLQIDIKKQLDSGKIEMKTPDGGRLAYESELLTMYRIGDATVWQSKQKIEKLIKELISFVGVSIPMSNKPLLSEQEHNDMAMSAIARAKKSGVDLFASNKEKLFNQIKGD